MLVFDVNGSILILFIGLVQPVIVLSYYLYNCS
jgi:hypothetical protein